MTATTGRFFDLPRFAISAVVGLLGTGVAAYVALDVVSRGRISIGGGLLAAALLLGAVVALAGAFPLGCRSCRKKLTETAVVFPGEAFEEVAAQLAQPAPDTLRLAHLPPAAGATRSLLEVAYCPHCRGVGVAHVREEAWRGQFYDVVRAGPRATLDGPAVARALSLVEARTAAHPAPSAS